MILPSKALLKPFVGLDNAGDVESIDDAKLTFSYRHVFKVGDVGLMLPENSSSEVVENISHCQLPNTNTVLFGMANLRGKIIPILNLYDLFGVESSEYSNSKILIVTLGDDVLGVLINNLPIRIKYTDEDRLSSLPNLPEIIRPYVESSYRVDSNDWLSWNFNDFFNDVHRYIQ